MSSPLNVALCDLNHTTVGLHTETMPLAVGLLGAYLASQFGTRVDVRLFKFVDDFEDDERNHAAVNDRVYDVVNPDVNRHSFRMKIGYAKAHLVQFRLFECFALGKKSTTYSAPR